MAAPGLMPITHAHLSCRSRYGRRLADSPALADS